MLLNKLREGAKGGITKFILFGFMVLAVGGLVFTDVGGFFRDGVARGSVARIGKEQITAVSFDDTVQRALYAQQIDAPTAMRLGLIDRILSAEISGRLLTGAAYELGIQVGDDTVTAQVDDLVTPMVTGDMSKKEVLRRILMNQGMSEQQFVGQLRRDMATTILRNALQSGTSMTPPLEARDLYQYQNEKRTVKALVLPHKSIKDYKEPADEVLLPFYQAGQERYAIPESRRFSMVVVTSDDVKKNLSVPDEELKTIYEDNVDSFRVPERRVMEQAVFSDGAKAATAVEKFAKKASLKSVVKSTTGSTDAYLGTETFQQDGLTKEIAAVAFVADKGALVGPIQTQLGWHVLVIKDILPPATQSFAEVKATLKKEILEDKLADTLYEAAAQIDDRLASGDSLDSVAKAMNLKLKSYGPVREDGSTPDDKEGLKGYDADRGSIMETVFILTEGESAPVMELSNGGYAVLRTDTVNLKAYTPFDEVKKDLKKIWVSDQQMVMNRQRASDSLRALANGEKTLTQIAKSYGVKVKTYTLTRNDDPPAPFTGPAKTKFFEIGKEDYSIANAKDGYMVGQVKKVTLPLFDKITDKDLEKTIETATIGTRDEFLLSYLQNLYDTHKVSINNTLLQTMYGPGREGN